VKSVEAIEAVNDFGAKAYEAMRIDPVAAGIDPDKYLGQGNLAQNEFELIKWCEKCTAHTSQIYNNSIYIYVCRHCGTIRHILNVG